MGTQFDVSFKAAITELRLIDARLTVLNSLVDRSKINIEVDQTIGNELHTVGFAFRDITLDIGTDNLFMPTDTYTLNRLNFSDEIGLILSRECLFQVAQSYEILETYLYNQVADYIRLNTNLQLPNDFNPQMDFQNIRKALKRVKDRVNNRHLIDILRTNNTIFQAYEVNNIYNLNFKEWLDMFSETRHSITHYRMKLNNYLKDEIPDCFNNYFKIKVVEDEEYIFTGVNDCKEFLHILAGYVFFIYKSVTDGTFGTKTKFSTISHVFHDPYYNSPIIEN
ncbi:hypothetical protein [Mucilaginibacter panaciglaebae]|uniref:Uncharacterized protein n=1 Tax=Mucilaginibacter panaciglaebae TaxID=502331 RepID=A0ABP7WZ66_9SPHI